MGKVLKRVSIILVIAVWSLYILPVFAQTSSKLDTSEKKKLSLKGIKSPTLNSKWRTGNKGWLFRLGQEEPKKFRKLVQKRHTSELRQLEYLRHNDLKKYYKAVQNIRDRRANILEKIKRKNPQRYKEIIQKPAQENPSGQLAGGPETPDQGAQSLKELQELEELAK